MARPRPVPPYRRVVEPSAWSKAWKMRLLLVPGDADPRVRHREVQDGRRLLSTDSARGVEDDLAAVP